MLKRSTARDPQTPPFVFDRSSSTVMSSGSIRPRHTRPAALFASYERAFERMPKRERLGSEQLTERARQLLDDRFGAAEAASRVGFAHVGVGLLAQHTCFVDGKAALLTLSQGTAVAVRPLPAGATEIVVEGNGRRYTVADGAPDVPDGIRLVAALCRELFGFAGGVQVAVITTIRPACIEPHLASLAVALVRAMHRLLERPLTEPIPHAALCATIAGILGGPYSKAYLVAAAEGTADAVTLVDTLCGSVRNVPIPASDDTCWGLVDVGSGAPQETANYTRLAAVAHDALQVLKRGPYGDLASLAALDFKTLHHALARLPRGYRPIVRFLVGESHRVQHFETAIRRADWPVVGGLLFFSHAALRAEWKGTNPAVDYVVGEVEAMGGEGMFGACLTGRTGCVLVFGQRYVLPQRIEDMAEGFTRHFERVPDVMLL